VAAGDDGGEEDVEEEVVDDAVAVEQVDESDGSDCIIKLLLFWPWRSGQVASWVVRSYPARV
jgi:hypothetical protein